jgi:hypothetical protein
MPNDTLPPSDSDPTIPPGPIPVIRAGEAEIALARAVQRVALALGDLEALASAVGRALDAGGQ